MRTPNALTIAALRGGAGGLVAVAVLLYRVALEVPDWQPSIARGAGAVLIVAAICSAGLASVGEWLRTTPPSRRRWRRRAHRSIAAYPTPSRGNRRVHDD